MDQKDTSTSTQYVPYKVQRTPKHLLCRMRTQLNKRETRKTNREDLAE